MRLPSVITAAQREQIRDLPSRGGNGDGVPGNERLRANTLPEGVRGRVLERLALVASRGFLTGNDRKVVQKFLAEATARHGTLTTLSPATFAKHQHMCIEKAIALERFDRPLSSIHEGFVRAAGSVEGRSRAPHRLFYQVFEPVGDVPPSGLVVPVFPGFGETGRDYYELADELSRQGHRVVLFDQPWSGYTETSRRGSFDSIDGLALDTASAIAFCKSLGEKVIPLANSFGSRALLATKILALDHRIALDGAVGTTALDGVDDLILAATFITPTPSWRNRLTAWLSRADVGGELLPSFLVPSSATDPVLSRKSALLALAGNSRGRIEVMTRDEARFTALLDQLLSSSPDSLGDLHLHMPHSRQDGLANPADVDELAARLGAEHVTQYAIEAPRHSVTLDPVHRGVFGEILERYTAPARSAAGADTFDG